MGCSVGLGQLSKVGGLWPVVETRAFSSANAGRSRKVNRKLVGQADSALFLSIGTDLDRAIKFYSAFLGVPVKKQSFQRTEIGVFSHEAERVRLSLIRFIFLA